MSFLFPRWDILNVNSLEGRFLDLKFNIFHRDPWVFLHVSRSKTCPPKVGRPFRNETFWGRPCVKSQGSHLALALSSALWGIQFVEMRRLVSNWKKNMGKHRDEVVVFLLEMSVFCFFFLRGREILKEMSFCMKTMWKSHQVWSVNTC